MSSMFKVPKASKIQPQAPSAEVIPAPTKTTAEVQTLAEQQKKRYTSGEGRASTLLTSGQGASGGMASAATLLGQVGR